MLVAAVLANGLSGCRDITGPEPLPVTRVQPDWVAGGAAAALDSATGLIRLAAAPFAYIDLLKADSIAAAALHLYLSPSPINTTPAQMEFDRGGAIDFAHLRVCGRAIYSLSPFGAFPPAVPGVMRRGWGPHWAIPFCGGDGTVQVSIGVPDNPTDITVDHDTVVAIRPQGGGEDFNGAGVPARYPSGLPVTPEQAIEALFKRTGKRVITTPVAFNQLDDRGFGQLPSCASWRISIESPVTVSDERTGAMIAAGEFFVRHAPACYSDTLALYIAAPTQPASRWIFFSKDTIANNSNSGLDSVAVPLSGPIVFDRVRVVR